MFLLNSKSPSFKPLVSTIIGPRLPAMVSILRPKLQKKINFKFHTRSPLSRTEPPLPVNVRGRDWKAGIDEGEESDAAAHLVS